MPDAFKNYQKLRGNFQENHDYRIIKSYRNDRILIFTPHGGGIERGTSELVRAIAGDNLPYYLFEGLMPTPRENQKMHITSTNFDEPRCLEMVRKYQTTLAIHGCEGKKPIIYAGGRDIDILNILIETLKEKGYPIEEGTGRYTGTCQSNICNCTATEKGIQMEFSNGMRRLLFDQWKTRKGRKSTTNCFDKLVSDIRYVIT